ncbi:MAG: hypothetical protein ABJ275_02895 [Maricaulaceae bacterium]
MSSQDLNTQLHNAIDIRLDPDLLNERPIPFTANWFSVSREDSIELLSQLTRTLVDRGNDTPWPLQHEALALRSTPLPFYEDAILIDTVLRHRIGWIGHTSFIVFNNRLVQLTHNSIEIHEINHDQSPNFETADNVSLYLKFFCWIVCGNEGPFSIVDEKERLERHLNEDAKTALEGFFTPLAPVANPGLDKKGHWNIAAPIYYNQTAFQAGFDVHPNGLVEMLTDDEIFDFGPDTASWQFESHIRYFRKDD